MCVLGEVKTRANPYHNKNGCSRETQYSDARLVEAHRLRQAATATQKKMNDLKGKGSFYIAQYPVRWTAQSALHFLPSLTDLFIPTPFSASPGSILAMQQLRATTKSLTFPPLSIARYSCIQLSRQGRQWREGKCPIFQTVAKGDSNPGSLDCESGILPLSYRAPLRVMTPPADSISSCNTNFASCDVFQVLTLVLIN